MGDFVSPGTKFVGSKFRHTPQGAYGGSFITTMDAKLCLHDIKYNLHCLLIQVEGGEFHFAQKIVNSTKVIMTVPIDAKEFVVKLGTGTENMGDET
jgi:hypothetical protein